ncbi:alternate-type signal peptide domain-containing protein [Xylanimonas allomyrinae]|uniref:Alternate-type signal peptide domain-containing protein n=1 Tax=Xylanimonas allomyrinae TaxID=2509459 RepID=A0A4P6ERQ3_9MICO|nr:alternate-type signal peptide domain-containing protein [Xylanimonas allomyrinae]QAY64603.1 alternate-type signal peptide domain-containing protein [Xylanimonas allomyrinae]
MSTNTTNTTNTTDASLVLVTEVRRRRGGAIWLAGGAALAVALLGGGTFALWSQSVGLDGGTITAGDLSLSAEASSFYDVSADRNYTEAIAGLSNPVVKGQKISPETWLMVPGDKVAAVLPVVVTLKGDNLVATLALSSEVFGQDKVIPGEYTYAVYDGKGTAIAQEAKVPAGGVLATLQAKGLGQGVAGGEGIPTRAVDGTETFTVVVFDTFDENGTPEAPGRKDALTDLEVTLTQIRTPGVGN